MRAILLREEASKNSVATGEYHLRIFILHAIPDQALKNEKD